MLYADITDFRLINYHYGMDRGNALLLSIEHYLRRLPHVLVFERVFSDQFTVLVRLPELPEQDMLIDTVEHRISAFTKHQQKQFPACRLRIACGIYQMPDQDLITAIDCANAARKLAKRGTDSHAVLFDKTVRDRMLDHQQIERETYLALREERFTFYLQPKVDLLTGKIIGAEALARGITTDGTIQPPASFTSIMEENGTIVDLDLLILRQVCAFLRRRLDDELPTVRISVNLSRLHIANPDTPGRLHRIAESYDIPPHLLEFELTETILLHEFSGAKTLIDALRDYGYQVSIDDFGAGYAGINIWQTLNFDALKLDRVFLSEEEPVKTRNAAILPNVINIAQQLEIKAICEGVEDAMQCRYLLRMGCTQAQGFYFSRPLPVEDFCALFEEQGGCYDLDFQETTDTRAALTLPPVAEEASAQDPPEKKKRSLPSYYAVMLACGLTLVLCVFATLAFVQQNVSELFVRSIQNNLDSYIDGQITETNGRIREVEATLHAIATVIEHEGEASVDSYLDAINIGNDTMTLLYTTTPDYVSYIKNATTDEAEMNAAYLERLQAGETVISEVVYSELAGGIFCFTLASPVMSDGEMIGCLRAIVNAHELVSTDQYASPYGEVVLSLLTNKHGELLFTESPDLGFQTPAEALRLLGLDPAFEDDILEMVSKPDSTSQLLGTVDGIPYYFSSVGYAYNDWQLAVFFRASAVNSITDTLMLYTFTATFVLLVVVLAICYLLFNYLRRWNGRLSLSEQRYQILEQFSDTALFDYDVVNDRLYLTPNAAHVFRAHEWKRKGFLTSMVQSSSIHPADCKAVQTMMEGKNHSEKQELRIRLLHPTLDRYTWCLVQFKYIYEDGSDGALASVVGKVVNIDEQQRHEEYLLEKSARDSLTGLLNRATTEKTIRHRLRHDAAGMLAMIDIDNFKQINDTQGHNIGDHVLREVAGYLKNVFSQGDVLGRSGGDEMLLYMRDIGDRTLVRRKMQLLQNLLNEHARGTHTPITVSIGIACFPEHGETFETLYRSADQAMYRAKDAGKNCFRFFDDPDK